MQIPLINGKKTNIKAKFNDALLENVIVNVDAVLGAEGYLTNHQGLKLVDDYDAEGSSRGGVYNERLGYGFRVIGNYLYTLEQDGKIKKRLGEIKGEGQVSMPYSFQTQAVVTKQGFVYLYDEENGLQQIVDENLGSVFDGTWIDGVYFFVDKDSPVTTDILAENSIRALSFGSAEESPDPIRACDKWRQFAVVFGSSTIQFYQNTGDLPFAFQPIDSYTIYAGIVGTHAKAKLPNDAGFILLGSSSNEPVTFLYAVNGRAESISTKTVDRIVEKYSEEELESTKLEYVKIDDKEFIHVHLPKHTLLYDITASSKLGLRQWSILKTGWEVQHDFKGYWQAINAIKMPALNKYTFGNRDNAKITVVDEESCDQLGEQQEHIIYSPIIRSPKPYSINKLQVQFLNGNNAINRTESIFMSTTEDGRTYSIENSLIVGKRGARWDQVIWRCLGMYRNWFGVKLRYVGKTNINISVLEINENA